VRTSTAQAPFLGIARRDPSNKCAEGLRLTDSSGIPQRTRKKVRSAWDLDRIFSLLKTNVDEIEKEHPSFFGTLKIEVNFREGEIETVIVDRRQTFKN
jgi:hypothetical protein